MHRIIKIYFGMRRKYYRKKTVKRVSKKYLENKEKARELVKARLEYFNTFYGYKWGKIAIRNQKTRWGSCSKKGNLNFNYKIVLLPPSYSDYIIVHELCHLEEFNHSENFWNLVAKTIPNWRVIRMNLRKSSQTAL